MLIVIVRMDSPASETSNIIENQTGLLRRIRKSHKFFQLHFAISIFSVPVYAAFLTLFFMAFETIFLDVSFLLALLIVSSIYCHRRQTCRIVGKNV